MPLDVIVKERPRDTAMKGSISPGFVRSRNFLFSERESGVCGYHSNSWLKMIISWTARGEISRAELLACESDHALDLVFCFDLVSESHENTVLFNDSCPSRGFNS
jgi:hypothetical protein